MVEKNIFVGTFGPKSWRSNMLWRRAERWCHCKQTSIEEGRGPSHDKSLLPGDSLMPFLTSRPTLWHWSLRCTSASTATSLSAHSLWAKWIWSCLPLESLLGYSSSAEWNINRGFVLAQVQTFRVFGTACLKILLSLFSVVIKKGCVIFGRSAVLRLSVLCQYQASIPEH